MNQPFKTQQEIYEHLVKGGKVKHHLADIVGFKNGVLYNFVNQKESPLWSFNTPGDWCPYVEPIRLEFETTVAVIPNRFAPLAHENFISIPEGSYGGKKFKVVMTEVIE